MQYVVEAVRLAYGTLTLCLFNRCFDKRGDVQKFEPSIEESFDRDFVGGVEHRRRCIAPPQRRSRDAQGRVVPTAMNEVTFSVTGPGRIIGVGNGDPSSHEPDRASKRNAFNGLCMALVQATKEAGEIRVEATSAGLASGTATIVTLATPARPALI